MLVTGWIKEKGEQIFFRARSFFFLHSYQEQVKEEYSHFMDKTEAGNKDIPEDVTRESLIALSYTEPPEDPTTGHLPDNRIVNNVEAIRGDVNEKYRSELISISYSQPPETPSPVVGPGEVKG
ncbi:hypothetical protein LIER_24924 [Lithospermum erythrorhizon]|uniref:Uncharacterized protein n=1 Tax=Lithospermum erythrorhizon TaxID=34254 RepID=A0AAV3R312_LITER